MDRLKKTVKLFGIGLLIVLASFGIGIGGAVPITSNRKKEDTNTIKTEIVEGKENKQETEEIKDIKE
ncbi:MAG: hypothetical protein H0W73_03415 [Bacteroidetes bacterium]|nr:hypothetical protein [Bacteroidota bacterium]